MIGDVQRRTKGKNATAKNRPMDNEQSSIPFPSRQGFHNDRTDFALDPALIFDQLPQPFRRIDKVFQSIFDDAWAMIEQRDEQRAVDQSKFESAQHTSSTMIDTPLPVSLIGSHLTGTLCFFHGTGNDQSYLACYDGAVDEIIHQINIDHPLKHLIVLKSESSSKETIYYLSVIDRMGYWKMMAYRDQQYYLLFTQHESEDEIRRPMCLTTQAGLHDEYIAVSWFGNNDSWLEVYKISKEQWKSEIVAHQQAMSVSETQLAEHDSSPPTENGSTLLRGQFSRPTLLFKVKAPKFSPGSNNFPQLMKNTENQANIGQGVSNHLYTSQIIDGKTALIRHLTIPAEKNEIADRSFSVTRIESSHPVIPMIQFMPAGTNNATGGLHSLAVSWPTTNQLLIYKLSKSENKGRDAFDTRPVTVWPFAGQISSLTYDSKHEHLAVGLQSGNVCIIDRSTGVNDLPSVQHVSPSPCRDLHALGSRDSHSNANDEKKRHGFVVLSNDGRIYPVDFKSILKENRDHDEENISPCFPPQHSKDASNIVRILFFNCQPSHLFLSVNELNRIYVNDARNHKQLCEIVLSQSKSDDCGSFQFAFIDQARTMIIGVPDNTHGHQSERNEFSPLRLYRVPLEHFPSLEHYYPERPISHDVEAEPIVESKPSKTTTSPAKKNLTVADVDKTSVVFDETIKELFRERQCASHERRERLRTRWNEIKLHFNPVYEQTT